MRLRPLPVPGRLGAPGRPLCSGRPLLNCAWSQTLAGGAADPEVPTVGDRALLHSQQRDPRLLCPRPHPRASSRWSRQRPHLQSCMSPGDCMYLCTHGPTESTSRSLLRKKQRGLHGPQVDNPPPWARCGVGWPGRAWMWGPAAEMRQTRALLSLHPCPGPPARSPFLTARTLVKIKNCVRRPLGDIAGSVPDYCYIANITIRVTWIFSFPESLCYPAVHEVCIMSNPPTMYLPELKNTLLLKSANHHLILQQLHQRCSQMTLEV